MLKFNITTSLKAVTLNGVTALLVAEADFNHTDIILLFDEEVATLVENALQTGERPVWLALHTADDYYGDDYVK